MKTLQAPLRTAWVVAHMLDRLDASTQAVDAHQYRVVAQRLAALLRTPDVDWTPLLENSRAATTVYENMHYERAGLCRSVLDDAAVAELAAAAAIESARQRPTSGPEHSSQTAA